MDNINICLTCPHRQCTHDPGGPPLAQCPLRQQTKPKPGPPVPEGYIPLSQARKELGIGYKTIKKWIASGRCPAEKIGHSRRATIAIPVEWIKAQKV